MENTIATAALVGVIFGSFSLAGLLEWLCVRGLMRLMPARAARAVNQVRVRPAARELFRASHLELHS